MLFNNVIRNNLLNNRRVVRRPHTDDAVGSRMNSTPPLRHHAPVAFFRYPIPRARTHGVGQFRFRHQHIQIFKDEILFAGTRWHLQANLVRKFRERSHIADNDRLAQPERAAKIPKFHPPSGSCRISE